MFSTSFFSLTSFQSPSYLTLGRQSRQNGTGGKSGSTAPAWLCFRSQWREKELNRGIVLKGMLVWGLCLYMHADTGTKRRPNDARLWERNEKEKDGRTKQKEGRGNVIISMERCDNPNYSDRPTEREQEYSGERERCSLS